MIIGRSSMVKNFIAVVVFSLLTFFLFHFFKSTTKTDKYEPSPQFFKRLSIARTIDRENSAPLKQSVKISESQTALPRKITETTITTEMPPGAGSKHPDIVNRSPINITKERNGNDKPKADRPILAQNTNHQPIADGQSEIKPIKALDTKDQRVISKNENNGGANSDSKVIGDKPVKSAPHGDSQAAKAPKSDVEQNSGDKQGSLDNVEIVGDKCVMGRNKVKEQEWLERDEQSSRKTSQKSKDRAETVRGMMDHAWSGYKKYAWGANELAPEVKMPHAGVFGGTRMGLTIVDSLDTLWVMGMFDEVADGKKWLVEHLALTTNVYVEVSVFEFNIRYVGGMLSMYALTNECEYKQLAMMCADKLVSAFNTTHGIPVSFINLKYGFDNSYTQYGTAVLSELGTLHLEFVYLSHITGIKKYGDLVEKLRDKLVKARINGLYSNTFYIADASFSKADMVISLGGAGDSFYEYLFKSFLQTGKTDIQAKTRYFEAMQAMEKAGLLKTSYSGLKYFGIKHGGTVYDQMEHLACFVGGVIGLSAEYSQNATATLELAEEIARTCHESYIRAESRIGPEIFDFRVGNEAKTTQGDRGYHLRPETVESWYFLQRVTHKSMYREWSWDFVQALEKHCKVENGYAGLKDVYLRQRAPDGKVLHEDVQQSFFLAETLKYLYLVFKDDDLLPLNDWVFNTEAHPLPVINPSITNA